MLVGRDLLSAFLLTGIIPTEFAALTSLTSLYAARPRAAAPTAACPAPVDVCDAARMARPSVAPAGYPRSRPRATCRLCYPRLADLLLLLTLACPTRGRARSLGVGGITGGIPSELAALTALTTLYVASRSDGASHDRSACDSFARPPSARGAVAAAAALGRSTVLFWAARSRPSSRRSRV